MNQRYHWDVVASYLFAPQILAGAGLTILLTVVSMTAGIALGTILAVMRLSANPILSTISRGYIWFFRGTPLLVQLIFWYNIAALYPVIAFGLPFGGPSLVLGSANVLISPLAAALLGLALNEAAYMAEIIRGGIGSVDKGQYDAARALGMDGGKLMRRVILPQAMRVVLPPTGNQVISMLKGTSLVSVLAISDLLYSAQIIYATNYQTIPLLIVASLWYLLMTTILSFFQTKLERRYGRGFDAAPRRPRQPERKDRQHATRRQRRHDMMSTAMVEAQGVRKSFGSTEILKGIDLRVERGSVTCLIGPSGSGKTTFLRCINHLEKVDAGRLYVDEHLVGYTGAQRTALRDEGAPDRALTAERGHGLPALQPLPAHDRAGEHRGSARPRARPPRNEVAAEAQTLLDRVGPRQPRPLLSAGTLRRPAAADRHRPRAGHETQAHALRRTHIRARSGARRRSPRRHEVPGRGRDDHGGRHPRTRLRPRRSATRWSSWTRASSSKAGPLSEVLGSPQHERTQAFLSKVL